MQNLGQALREAVENMTSSPSDEAHVCPICNRVVPKKRLFVLGVEKIVQPRCRCEVEAWEKGQLEAIERHRKNEIERRFAFSELGERFENCRFETFDPVPGAEKALDMSRKFAELFDQNHGQGLLLWGQPGNGKSHLAAAICHALKENGRTVVFQKVPNLLERIRSTFRRGANESEREIMDALRNCDLLVLDDIGAEKISDWVLDVMFRVIDSRYSWKRPVVFTTNFSPTELLHRFMPDEATFEQEIAAKRIHDRIIEMSVIVENRAQSYRMKVAAERAKRREPDQRRMWAE